MSSILILLILYVMPNLNLALYLSGNYSLITMCLEYQLINAVVNVIFSIIIVIILSLVLNVGWMFVMYSLTSNKVQKGIWRPKGPPSKWWLRFSLLCKLPSRCCFGLHTPCAASRRIYLIFDWLISGYQLIITDYTTLGLHIQPSQKKISAIFGLIQVHIWPPPNGGQQIWPYLLSFIWRRPNMDLDETKYG